MLAAGTPSGALTWRDVDPESWRSHAGRIAGRNLGQQEWYENIDTSMHYRCNCPELPAGQGAPTFLMYGHAVMFSG